MKAVQAVWYLKEGTNQVFIQKIKEEDMFGGEDIMVNKLRYEKM